MIGMEMRMASGWRPGPGPRVWRPTRLSSFDRTAFLHRVADVIEARRDALAWTLTLDQGKPLRAEVYDEVDELVMYWRQAPRRWSTSTSAPAIPGPIAGQTHRPVHSHIALPGCCWVTSSPSNEGATNDQGLVPDDVRARPLAAVSCRDGGI
jgi:hypothetical protein